MKVVFLDIDGVIQPFTQYRFEHKSQMPALCEKLNEMINNGFDYVKYNKENSLAPYDIGAVYFDWETNSVQYLREMLDKYDAKIVLSSDWKEKGTDLMKALLDIWHLGGYLYGITDSILYTSGAECPKDMDEKKIRDYWWKRKLQRYDAFEPVKEVILENLKKEGDGRDYIDERCIEILEYLDRHREITGYVAIDDRNLERGLKCHFVETRSHIKEEDFKKAMDILNLEDGPYPLPKEAVTEQLVAYRNKYNDPEPFTSYYFHLSKEILEDLEDEEKNC